MKHALLTKRRLLGIGIVFLSIAMLVVSSIVSYPDIGMRVVILPGQRVTTVSNASYVSISTKSAAVFDQSRGWSVSSLDFAQPLADSQYGALEFKKSCWTIKVSPYSGGRSKIDVSRAVWPLW